MNVGGRVKKRSYGWLAATFCVWGFGVSGHAEVSDLAVVDVTPKAVGVVWASDEAITSATVRVFNDAAGTDEITNSLVISTASAAIADSHTNGIARVQIAGLAPNQAVFLQTVTQSASGLFEVPAAGALLMAITSNQVTRIDSVGDFITNDLISESVLQPADSATPLAGGLIRMRLVETDGSPSTGSISAQVGDDDGGSDAVLLNMNNLYALSDANTAPAAAGSIVEISEYRGNSCALSEQVQIRYGRVPEHEEVPAITELETLVDCFFADRVCDDTVNALDVQFVLNAFNEASGSCAFNPYLDIDDDGQVNALDVQAVLNRFGDAAPFQ